MENLKGGNHVGGKCKWEDIIKTELKGIRCQDMDWLHLDQSDENWWALVNTVMKLRVP
jgi:hypothetical protein